MTAVSPAAISVGAALRRAESMLRTHSDSARADAEILLAHVLQVPRQRLHARGPAPLTETQQAQVEALLVRRAAGEPVAYLTGICGFWTLDLAVNPAVLIPRPETERLVEWALQLIDRDCAGGRQSALRMADLGTGSGAIALALASELPQSRILATDVSPAALGVARMNAVSAGLPNVHFAEGSWAEPLARVRLDETPDAPGFDFILGNPPYIAAADPHLPALRHEPVRALVSGADGLDAMRQIVATAPPYLCGGGWLLLEHGYDQAVAVRVLLETAGLIQVQTRRDLAGHERVTGGQRA